AALFDHDGGIRHRGGTRAIDQLTVTNNRGAWGGFHGAVEQRKEASRGHFLLYLSPRRRATCSAMAPFPGPPRGGFRPAAHGCHVRGTSDRRTANRCAGPARR